MILTVLEQLRESGDHCLVAPDHRRHQRVDASIAGVGRAAPVSDVQDAVPTIRRVRRIMVSSAAGVERD